MRLSIPGAMVLGLCGAVSGLAQAQSPLEFSVQSNLVILSATAVDGRGHSIQDLKPEEFQIYEEGRPQRIAHFSRGTDLKARVLLLVDASGSMNAQLKSSSSRMAVIQLMNALAPGDEVALAGFDSRYFGLVPFTTEHAKIEAAFGELTPWGSTALHDALDKAAYDIASHGEGRRAVVVVTDGIDNASEKTPEEVIARSRALDVPIYAITVLSAIDDPSSPLFAGKEKTTAAAKGALLLERYAAMSGGAAFEVSSFKALREAAAQISSELKNQYRLGYDAPEGPSHFRRVEVKAKRRGIVVRTRSGYMPST